MKRIFCFLGWHKYEYFRKKLFGMSLFGSSYDEHYCRKCSNCDKFQVLIRGYYETI